MTFHEKYLFKNGSVFCILILLLQLSGFSQNDSSAHWSIMVSPQGGFIIPHHESVTHLIQGHSLGSHLYVNRKMDGSKYWHRAYNFPECGIDISAINSGNTKELGSQYSSSYLVNLPLNRGRHMQNNSALINRKFYHWIGLGIGLGYSTQRWDLEYNHRAPMLGSRLNAAISFQYSLRLVAFSFGEFRAGFRVLHFSNGAFQLPNLGTNNAGIFLSYSTAKHSHIKVQTIPAPSIERYIWSAGIVSGLKEILPPNGRKYIASVLSFLGEKRISYKSAFGVGADVLFDASSIALAEQRSGSKQEVSRAIQVGGLLSYSLFFDRLSFKMQQGFYLRDEFRINGSLYHRFGLRYSIGRSMYAQLTLKTHFAKADYGELGIGYLWRR
jgi:hypothetical protein